MEIPVSCTCGKSFKAKPTLAGKTVACPSCKSPIAIPAAAAPAPPSNPVPAAPAPPSPAQPAPAATPMPGAEIVMACGCGQQFKVDGQFAGQQVNCPACQTLCVIPTQQASPFMGGMPQQMAPQPAMQQPMMQQPMMQQPAYPPAPGPMDYQAPAYMGGGRRATHKTGLGIFIFAIAACVFAGGFGFQRLAEGISTLRFISARASSSSTRGMTFNQSSADTARTLNNITGALIKIGAIAIILGFVAIVVASVFCIMSPSPLMALGITEVCVAGTAAILLAIYEIVPTLQDGFLGFGVAMFGSIGGNVADAIIGLMVRFTEIGTFLIFSIFMIFALQGKQNRRVDSQQPKISLITFSIAAGIHLLLFILGLLKLQGEWVFYFYMFIRWLGHASMIVGLVFIIKSSFESRAVYRV